MNDDELKSLLNGAEAGLKMSALAPAELARRVRRLDQKRRQRTRMLTIAAPLVLLAAVVAGWSLLPDPANRGPIAARELNEIERLRQQAEYHERLARQLMVLGDRGSSPLVLAESDPFEDVREQVDVVAYRMILRADDLQSQMMPLPEAVELYRNVVRLFPNTYSAEVARQRLLGLGASAEET